MTLTIGLLQLKPGTGKSTSAVHLAAALNAMRWRVVLVDADPGRSVLSWSETVRDETGEPFPWRTVAGSKSPTTLYRDLVRLDQDPDVDAVVVDAPQLEDHGAIGTAVMRAVREWVMPVAPAGIELDRAATVHQLMDQVAGEYGLTDRRRWALLNRSNKAFRTRRGLDQDAADMLSGEPFNMTVFADQVPFHDGLYRQGWGLLPETGHGPYWRVANILAGTPGYRADRCAYCETMIRCYHPRGN